MKVVKEVLIYIGLVILLLILFPISLLFNLFKNIVNKAHRRKFK